MADGSVIFDVQLDSSGVGSALSGVGSKIAKSAAIAATGAAIGKALTSAIGVGMEFDSVMSKVEALSGANAAQMTQLSNTAKALGETTKFTASEVGSAFTYMAQAGWGVESMLAGIQPILSLSAADGLDLATTSDIVTDALTAMGYTAADTGQFVDVLATAAAASNTNVQLMGETFKYVAPVAGAMGYSMNDIALAVGLMANAGIKGSQAGTALRSTLTRLAKPTAQVQGAMKDLGVSLTNSDGSMKSLGEVMGDLRKGFAGLTEAEQAQYAATIAGQEGMSGLLAIVNASPEEFEKLSEALENSAGSAERMAAIMLDNLEGDVTLFKSAAEGLALAFYETFSDSLRTAVQTGTSIVSKLTGGVKKGDLSGALSSIFEEDIPAIAGMLGETLGKAFAKLPEFLDDTGDVTSSLVTGLAEGAKSLAQGIAKGIGDNLPDLLPDIATALIGGLSTAISSLPQFAEVASSIVTGLKNALTGSDTEGTESVIAEQMAGLGQTIIDALVKSISELPDLAVSVGEIIKTLALALSEALSGMGEGMDTDGLGETFSNLASAIIKGIATAISALPDLAVSVGEIIGALAKALGEGLAGVAEGVDGNVIVESLGTLAKALVDGIAAAIPGVIEGVNALGGALISGITDWLSNTEEGSASQASINEFAGNLLDGIAKALELNEKQSQSIQTALSNIISNLFLAEDDAKVFVSDSITALNEALTALSNWCNENKQVVIAALGALAVALLMVNAPVVLLAAAAAILIANWNGIKAAVTAAKEAITGFFSKVWEEKITPIVNAVKASFEALTTSISNAIEMAKKFFSGSFFEGENPFDPDSFLGKAFSEGQFIADNQMEFSWADLWALLFPSAGAESAELPEGITAANDDLASQTQEDFHKALIEAFQNGEISYAELVAAAFGGGEEGASVEDQMEGLYAQMEAIGAQLKASLIAGMTGTGTEGAEGAAAGAAEGAVEGAEGEGGGLTGLGLSLAQKVADGVKQGAPKVKTALTKAVNDAKAAVDVAQFKTLGQQIAQGIADGITAGSGAIASALIAAVMGAKAAAEEALGIESPSRVFRDDVGRWIPAGAAEGVEMEAWQLRQAVRDMARGSLAGLEGLDGLSKRAAASLHFGWADAKMAKRAAMAAYGQPIQEVNFNVPVQTPDEFAETVELFMTYGLEADY